MVCFTATGEGRRASTLMPRASEYWWLRRIFAVLHEFEGEGGYRDHKDANAPTKFSTKKVILEGKVTDFSRGIRIRLDS